MPTVQGEIENSLSIIFRDQKINLIGSGRTDTGVHAKAQYANIFLDTNMSPDQICKALNRELPNDIYIKNCFAKNKDFHARFSAKKREYNYYIINNYSVLRRNHSWYCKWDLNEKHLKKCAENLIGEFDFSLFSKASSETKNKKCIIYKSYWEFSKDYKIYTISGNRFLQHMVRLLVGTMVEVSKGKIPIDDFHRMLELNKTNYHSVRAPAKGLFLNNVYYE